MSSYTSDIISHSQIPPLQGGDNSKLKRWLHNTWQSTSVLLNAWNKVSTAKHAH